ncbi:triacylglycerol lipase [Ancylostoma caninum]|uniref:Triacylglycerol lipase n=1 Tax=Ancylostoma caninum TaxID=29170 RepID=A0A368FBD1_ANCCA|nr:triacylglycerol lipase [Ancylostoma caninum]
MHCTHCEAFQIHRQINIDCDKGNICSGFTALLHSHKAIAVSFRGTTNPLQLLDEAIKSVINSWVDWPYGGMVSKYFYDGFMRIWKGGMEADMKLLTEQYPDYEIWVTGHSLGGAMASLAAHAIVGSGIADSKRLKLITLGQPRTGDKVFAKNHTATIDYSFRITHWRDVVPHIPSFDERPAGYYHHMTEVFYKKGMPPKDYIICKEYEDFKCSDGLWVHTSVANHKEYFGKVIRDWGIAGCL